MKSLGSVILGIFLSLAFQNLTYGKTIYVNDYIDITLRASPGNDHKVIGMLSSGTSLELKGAQEGWSFVVPLEGPFEGKEGWVLTRYTTPSKPKSLRVDELLKENEELKAQIEDYTRKINDLSQELSSVKSELETTKAALQKAETEYNNLRAEAADFLKLKGEYEELKEKFSKINQNYEKISLENDRLQKAQNIKWFLAGSGVFFAGWLIGTVTSRRRNRRFSFYR